MFNKTELKNNKIIPTYKLYNVPNKHLPGWNSLTHYNNCGQSCLCCRSIIEGPLGFGTCLICDKLSDLKRKYFHI